MVLLGLFLFFLLSSNYDSDSQLLANWKLISLRIKELRVILFDKTFLVGNSKVKQ